MTSRLLVVAAGLTQAWYLAQCDGHAWVLCFCAVLFLCGIGAAPFSTIGNRRNSDSKRRVPSAVWCCLVALFVPATGDFILSAGLWNGASLWNLYFAEGILLAHAVALLFVERHKTRSFCRWSGMLLTLGCVGAIGTHEPGRVTFDTCMCGGLVVLSALIAGQTSERIDWPPLKIGILVSVFPAIVLISLSWNSILQFAGGMFHEWAVVSSVSPPRVYPKSGTLDDIIHEKKTDPMAPAVRVNSVVRPGYLRGRVFDLFGQNRWYTPHRLPRRYRKEFAKDAVVISAQPAGSLVGRNVDVPPNSGVFLHNNLVEGEITGFEIENDPKRGNMYFSRLGWDILVAPTAQIVVDRNNVLIEGIDKSAPYTVYCQGRNRSTTPETLSDTHRNRLLRPLIEDEDIVRLARELSGDSDLVIDKVVAVEEFFQNNFEYGLIDTPFPVKSSERLTYFLRNRPAAHCEYFATAAVALLRLMGVPSRYVVGYYVDEFNDEIDVWVGYNRNAHAWVEAWIEEKSCWVTVEPTPGRDAGRNQDTDSIDQNRLNESQAELETLVAENEKSTFAGLMMLLSSIALPAVTIVAAAGAIVGLTLLILKRIASAGMDPNRKLLRRLERSLSRTTGARLPGETMHQYARRLRDESTDWFHECADVVEEFADLRFGTGSELAWKKWRTTTKQILAARTRH